MSAFAVLANLLKPAPGNHSGTYFTVGANVVRSSGKNPIDETRTNGEGVHHKGPRHQGDVNCTQRILGCRVIFIVLGLDIHSVRDREGQRPGKASRSKGKRSVRDNGMIVVRVVDIQMDMLQEAVGGFREPVEEDIYRLVNLIVELVCD